MPARPPRPSDADLVHLVRAGNREAGDLLVRRHSGLVRSLVGRLRILPANIDKDDLIQVGLLAVYETAAKHPPGGWDRTASTKFSTYCYNAILWAIRKELGRSRSAAVMESDLTANLEPDTPGLAGFPARIPIEPIDISPLLQPLTPLETSVVSVLYEIDGRRVDTPDLHRRFGIKDLARRLGVKPTKVRDAIDSAHAKMGWSALCPFGPNGRRFGTFYRERAQSTPK